MLVYNVTTQMDEAVHIDYLQWVRNVLAPAMMETGCFLNFKILRLLEPDSSPAVTLAIQYELDGIGSFDDFQVNFMAEMQQLAAQQWGDQVNSFSSLLEML